MRYLSNLLILLAFIGCAETKTDLSGNTPLKINDFNAAFKQIDLPIRINDTNLTNYTDTSEIGRKALAVRCSQHLFFWITNCNFFII